MRRYVIFWQATVGGNGRDEKLKKKKNDTKYNILSFK